MQSKVIVDLKINRIVLSYRGVVDKKEVSSMYTDVRFAAADLRSGFDVISDFSECEMAHVAALQTMRKIILYLIESGAGEAVRILGETGLVRKQIINFATWIPGHKPISASSFAEAEEKLAQAVRRDGMRIHFHELPMEYILQGVIKKGMIDNISISGCAVSCEGEIPALETVVPLIFVVCDSAETAPYEVKISGKVVRADDRGFAVHFEEEDHSVRYKLFSYMLSESQRA